MWRGRAAAGRDGGTRVLMFSETQLCRCTDIGSWKPMFFWKVSFIGVFICLARHPQQNTLGLMGVGGCIWKSLKSPRLLVFVSENVTGAWLCGEFCFDLAVSLNFLPKRRLFWFLVWFRGRMAFGEKDNQRKWGGLGFHLENLSPGGKNTFN